MLGVLVKKLQSAIVDDSKQSCSSLYALWCAKRTDTKVFFDKVNNKRDVLMEADSTL